MLSKIIVATDGSDHGRKAVVTAADMAAKYGGSLRIAHVMMHGEPPSAFRRMAQVEHMVDGAHPTKPDIKNIPGGAVALTVSAEQKRVDQQLVLALAERVAAFATADAEKQGAKDVTTEILEGDPANQILQAAERAEADLIVIGSRGFGPLKTLLMGSVSQKVNQLAKCSCMTVR